VKILSFKSLKKKNKTKQKKKEIVHVHHADYQTWLAGVGGQHFSTRPWRLTVFAKVNFTAYFFFRDKQPIDMKMLEFFLGKCIQTAAKAMVVDRKKNRRKALLYLAPGPLANAANSSIVLTEFAAEPTTKMKTSKANS